MARKICETQRRMIAAPSYFKEYGRPERIDDLNEHKLLHYPIPRPAMSGS